MFKYDDPGSDFPHHGVRVVASFCQLSLTHAQLPPHPLTHQHQQHHHATNRRSLSFSTRVQHLHIQSCKPPSLNLQYYRNNMVLVCKTLVALSAAVAAVSSTAQAVLVDAGAYTTMSVYAPLYDTRLSNDGGCDPSGCVGDLTRVRSACVVRVSYNKAIRHAHAVVNRAELYLLLRIVGTSYPAIWVGRDLLSA